MKKIVVIFLLVLLIGVGIIFIMVRINTEKIGNYTSEDHLYHLSVTIKEIDNEQKKITAEVIEDNSFLDVGEQLIVDISNAEDYGYHKFFEKNEEIKIYFFPFELKKIGDATQLMINNINDKIGRIK